MICRLLYALPWLLQTGYTHTATMDSTAEISSSRSRGLSQFHLDMVRYDILGVFFSVSLQSGKLSVTFVPFPGSLLTDADP